MAGEVIGINSVIFAPGTYSGSAGVGFAIPSSNLHFVMDRLMAKGRFTQECYRSALRQ
jgi:S1-C subfamily serine protease